MMEDTGEDVLRQKPGVVLTFFKRIGQTFQIWLDKLPPHTTSRWKITVVLILLFYLRIFIKQGWYVVAYLLAIYHMRLAMAFLSPKTDPPPGQSEEDEFNDGIFLPVKQNDVEIPIEDKVFYIINCATF